jgi:GH15 family glucan-1,4-alpha-glucosidase
MSQFSPLKNYRLIGDLQTAALVSNQGSIDWLCLPDFDSPGVFNRILDNEGGSFSVVVDDYRTESRYIEDTAVIRTTFTSDDDSFSVRDFMVPQPENKTGAALVRKVIGKSGSSEFEFTLTPRPQYGKPTPGWTYNEHTNRLYFQIHEGSVTLHLPRTVSVCKHQAGYRISVSVQEGQEVEFQLVYTPAQKPTSQKIKNTETKTMRFWQNWTDKTDTSDFSQGKITRSAITLKLLQHNESGALVAAPTTSLPEVIGGSRNWDYRYCWMRDATFTLYSLLTLGLTKETTRFLDYVSSILISEKDANDIKNLDHLYTIDGSPVQAEQQVPHLSGYQNSRPVRVGNSAANQFQLDTYGVMIDAFYLAQREGVTLTKEHKTIIVSLADSIANQWQKKDNGIWEVRGKQQHYTYSKVMCWVGIDRILRMKQKLPFDHKKIKELEALRKNINDWIWDNCFDSNRQTFTQHPNTDAQDATNFLFPLVQFLDKDEAVTETAINNTRDELCFDDAFVYRYRNDDGLSGEEGAFLLCSYWLISSLAKIGKQKQARDMFTDLQSVFTKSGLQPEEINSNTSTYLGNFPQGFSHMGHIMSAYYINRYADNNPQK